MARRIIIEAVACVTKYFVAASVDRGFFLLISMGIIASRLNSRPTHISIRLVLDNSPIRLIEGGRARLARLAISHHVAISGKTI